MPTIENSRIICVSVFTFQRKTHFSVYLLVRFRRAVFSLLEIINWHQEVDATKGCWGKKFVLEKAATFLKAVYSSRNTYSLLFADVLNCMCWCRRNDWIPADAKMTKQKVMQKSILSEVEQFLQDFSR